MHPALACGFFTTSATWEAPRWQVSGAQKLLEQADLWGSPVGVIVSFSLLTFFFGKALTPS